MYIRIYIYIYIYIYTNIYTCIYLSIYLFMYTHHKTAQQRRGGMMDRDRKTEGGASSEPAFDVSQVCLRVRGLFGLTSEFVAVVQIERGQGGARLEHNDVTCGAMTAVGVFL